VNIALVLAGGSGVRMGGETPKQFLEVLGKPVIGYTLETLEAAPCIDAVCVVCVAGYEDRVWGLARDHALAKVQWVTPGGASFQESARAGAYFLQSVAAPDDLVVMVMSVQPLISVALLEDSLRVCAAHGNAIAGKEAIYNFSPVAEDGSSGSYTLKRGQMTLNLPWTFPLRTLVSAYRQAEQTGAGLGPFDYTPTMLIDQGERIWFSRDDALNQIKITTQCDLDLFEGYIRLQALREPDREEKA